MVVAHSSRLLLAVRESSIARTPAAFVSAFESIGYTQCNDSVFEEGFDSIAIYVNSLGEVAHAARQRASNVD